ncbi:hypothetical protein HanXRQr2_Chr17g0785491 [Helianthus annuus]|uniref:Uncharacterized protein n=1 Tax=Helianthus annuus TaxID=4232 RepID=A0A9K3DFP5_HELAN|nr:hypothetical protein HanXRQr2_Chr17g0785491 [Helianthus annuus]
MHTPINKILRPVKKRDSLLVFLTSNDHPPFSVVCKPRGGWVSEVIMLNSVGEVNYRIAGVPDPFLKVWIG